MLRIFLVYALLSIAYLNCNAQTISIGGGYAYGMGVEQSGVNFGGTYYLSYPVLLTGDMNYFFPFNKNLESGDSYINRTELNITAKYRWFYKKNLYLYPLAGVNWILEWESEVELNRTETSRSSEGGLVAGLGIGYQFNRVVPFCEFRHTFSYLTGSTIIVGVAIKSF